MSDPTKGELLARIAELEKQSRGKKSGKLEFKVGEKGGVSVYGLGRFPVTLYFEQWNRLLDVAGGLRAFLDVTGHMPTFTRRPEFGIGGQTARPVHGGQHPVSTSALRNARSRNEFNAYNHPVWPAFSAGSGRGFGGCFGSALLLSSL